MEKWRTGKQDRWSENHTYLVDFLASSFHKNFFSIHTLLVNISSVVFLFFFFFFFFFNFFGIPSPPDFSHCSLPWGPQIWSPNVWLQVLIQKHFKVTVPKLNPTCNHRAWSLFCISDFPSQRPMLEERQSFPLCFSVYPNAFVPQAIWIQHPKSLSEPALFLVATPAVFSVVGCLHSKSLGLNSLPHYGWNANLVIQIPSYWC
jgi:hypothetical protein